MRAGVGTVLLMVLVTVLTVGRIETARLRCNPRHNRVEIP